ncbi:MAG: hypothetical protein Q7J68_06885 [Thermoplasmata archaeon]|nr:hypothetical protein [Thermoplasmata archaeon]
MFKLSQLKSAFRIETPRPSNIGIEHMHDEQMHNICEFNERSDIGWNAGMNL